MICRGINACPAGARSETVDITTAGYSTSITDPSGRSLSSPDLRAWIDQRYRRNARCRHFERVRAKRASGKASHPRRTTGAEAVRYAIWAYMSSDGGG
jgi:hypothetical protein